MLMYSEMSPPPYMQDLPNLHTTGPSHVLLQVGPYYKDLDGEYCGGVVGEGEKGGGRNRKWGSGCVCRIVTLKLKRS